MGIILLISPRSDSESIIETVVTVIQMDVKSCSSLAANKYMTRICQATAAQGPCELRLSRSGPCSGIRYHSIHDLLTW